MNSRSPRLALAPRSPALASSAAATVGGRAACDIHRCASASPSSLASASPQRLRASVEVVVLERVGAGERVGARALVLGGDRRTARPAARGGGSGAVCCIGGCPGGA